MAISNPTPASPNNVHVDSLLSDFATSYENRTMIADIVCPIVDVDHRSDIFWKKTKRGSAHIVKDLMGPKTPANETTYELAQDNYSVQDRGLMDWVPYAMIANADDGLSPEELTVEDITTKLMLAREVRVATLYTTGANFAGNTAAVVTKWNNPSSTPLADINGAKASLGAAGPSSKVVMYMSLAVWNALRTHPEILALKGLDKGMVSRDELAGFFEVDEIAISDAQKDTENMGQDAIYSSIWSGTVFGMVRVPVTPSRKTTAFGVTFRVKPGMQVYTWDDMKMGTQGSKGIRVAFSDDEKILQPDQGYLLTAVL